MNGGGAFCDLWLNLCGAFLMDERRNLRKALRTTRTAASALMTMAERGGRLMTMRLNGGGRLMDDTNGGKP
jgi:hypothetical protein